MLQWPVEPAAQQSAGHIGSGVIQYIEQGVFLSTGKVGIQFQILATGGIQGNGLVAVFRADTANVGQGTALGIPGVLQQAAGGANGQWQVVTSQNR